ncbi:hypothetical protein [Bradyrhizobium nanningense]|uniref:hypothetical protein n=1 Tax=Bradyrhizobium nanningense TaxID=1325118 RepID=UPI001FE022E4|nr:hypothetical protein [Bradyrhizobium nanningense]
MSEPYARTMELGWQPFALSLIASEVSEEERRPNLQFLHELSNFNFVSTPQGKLGDLLKQGRCKIGNPVGVDYVIKPAEVKDDVWRVQLSVDCNIVGPSYFTHDGALLFEKHGGQDWQPQSFFAKRIATYAPGS